MPNRSRYCLLFLSFGLLMAGFTPQASAQDKDKKAQDKKADDFAKVAVPFLKKHCYHCHGPDKKKARHRLSSLQG